MFGCVSATDPMETGKTGWAVVDRRVALLAVNVWVGTICSATTPSNAFPEFQLAKAAQYLLTVSQQALQQAGTNADTCLLVARVHSDLGRTDEAENWALKATQIDSTRADVELFLARLLIRQDRMEEAVDHLRKALRIDSKLSAASRLLGMALERLGDSKGAEQTFTQLLERDPSDAEAGFLFGRLLLDQDRTTEAIACLEKVCRADPGSASGFYLLYQAQTRAGQQKPAQKSLQTFQELKKKEGVRTVASEASQSEETKLRDSAAELHNQMAVLLQRSGRATEAEVQLRQAVLVAPEQPLAYQRLAAICVQTGRLHEASEILAVLVRLEPENSNYRVNRGTVLLQLKDYQTAVAEFQKALETNPNQPEALNNLARYFLGTRQQVSEALVFARRLVALQPTAAHYDLLGWALYLNGQTYDALEACNQAVRRDPDNLAYLERRRRLQKAADAATR